MSAEVHMWSFQYEELSNSYWLSTLYGVLNPVWLEQTVSIWYTFGCRRKQFEPCGIRIDSSRRVDVRFCVVRILLKCHIPCLLYTFWCVNLKFQTSKCPGKFTSKVTYRIWNERFSLVLKSRIDMYPFKMQSSGLFNRQWTHTSWKEFV